MNLQHLIDGMNANMQKARAETQLTLGGLIKALEAMPADAKVTNLRECHSYRGYYDDLAFKRRDGTRRSAELLADCQLAMGRVFGGYKGGDYVMGERTPLWVSEYGECGVKLMAIHPDGSIDTAEDEF